jgi:hypothetical protein
MKMEITKTSAKWLVNGKTYSEMNLSEKLFFDEFLIAMRWEKECEQFDNQQKKSLMNYDN